MVDIDPAALPGMLSSGALRQLFNNDGDLPYSPVFQILTVKAVPKPNDMGPPMHRLVFSDGDVWVQGLLAAELAGMVDSPRPLGNGTTGDPTKFHRGSIIRATNIKASKLANNARKFLVVHGLEIVSSSSWDKIGQPAQIDDAPPPAAAPEPVHQSNATNLNSTGFYGQPPQAQAPAPSNDFKSNAPAQTRNNQFNQTPAAAASRGAAPGGGFMPISELSPYQHKWSIRATCSRKFDIKTWAKPTSTGKLFSAVFMDESGEIRATGFNAECDKLYDLLEEGVVYYISSPCAVKYANKKFSNVKHDYELTFERDSRVERAPDQTNVPAVQLNYVSIGDLANVAKDEVINIIGVLTDMGPETELVSKVTNKPYSKRDLTIVDDSLFAVKLTIWGNTAHAFSSPVGSTISFKDARVSDFGGKSLSLLSSGSMTIDPDIEQAHRLKGWYASNGQASSCTNLSSGAGGGGGGGESQPRGEIHPIQRVKDEGLGSTEEPAYFTVKGTVVYFNKDTFAYPACSSPDCNRKVTETPEQTWRCEFCKKEFPRPKYRYMLNVNVSDQSGQLWITCFDETAKAVIGMSANDFTNLKETDDEGFVKVVDAAAFKTYFFRCKAKMDTYQDTSRIRYQALGANPVNYASEGNRLTTLIQMYENVNLAPGGHAGGDNNNSLFVN